MAWRLSGKAEEDLIAIWLQSARTFGPDQADRYQDSFETAFALLAEFPKLTCVRTELTPPIRIHPCGVHLIVYLARPDGDILVVRVRHSREDWTSDPI